jgi:hypothetical protein
LANYSDIGIIAEQHDFKRRVAYALTVASVAAYNEAGTVPGHAARAAYATKVLNGDFSLDGAVLGVLSNPTIAAEGQSAPAGNSIPDADIQFAINSIFSALAGA